MRAYSSLILPGLGLLIRKYIMEVIRHQIVTVQKHLDTQGGLFVDGI